MKDIWHLSYILSAAVLLRVGLILYSEWHDAHSVVKYTDVDYRVFTDAVRYLLHPEPGNRAQGPLGHRWNIGNPYTRETYRYTPLLAVLLAPNEWLHPSFGKYLFAACDIANGVLIYRLLLHVILPRLGQANNRTAAVKGATLHLLNPLVFSISTRGSSESVLCLFVLLTLYTALVEQWIVAAVCLAVSTHWKIYPWVYGISCLAPVAGLSWHTSRSTLSHLWSLVMYKNIGFAGLSVFVFSLLGAVCYDVWGEPFLQEAYLYHLHRLDHRHNFSPYFYLTYLTYPGTATDTPTTLQAILRSPLVSFVPQMTLTLGAGILFGNKEDLVFAWFLQTFLFVLFNKVCTSQYFLWYMLFLPLLTPYLSMTPRKALALAAVWAGVQGLWLAEAYQLEFMGKNVFFGLWIRSLVYVAGNCWVLAGIMDAYRAGDKEKPKVE
ncbi:glycosyltransferase family 50 protein [Cylindrobasidium torrendii FP15055 ss-10]|uniref:GPI mannosyltransferase 1 n=1 Tax=Cylindrobasidium torrendii FP15055 ss-10 TaxID=1314674 RepID=A0A0D7BUK4_9AGAR|nr:glycosyltransferase family 50 protein [Cylindrobasidium torrendii FP15055 ss-10]